MGYPSFLEDIQKISENLQQEQSRSASISQLSNQAQERRVEREQERSQSIVKGLLEIMQSLKMNLDSVESSELRDLLELQRDTRKRSLLAEHIRSKQSEYRRLSQQIAEMRIQFAILEQTKEKKLLQMLQSVSETARPDIARDSIRNFFNLRLEGIVNQHPLTQRLRQQINDEKAWGRQAERTISDLRKRLAQAKTKANIRSP